MPRQGTDKAASAPSGPYPDSEARKLNLKTLTKVLSTSLAKALGATLDDASDEEEEAGEASPGPSTESTLSSSPSYDAEFRSTIAPYLDIVDKAKTKLAKLELYRNQFIASNSTQGLAKTADMIADCKADLARAEGSIAIHKEWFEKKEAARREEMAKAAKLEAQRIERECASLAKGKGVVKPSNDEVKQPMDDEFAALDAILSTLPKGEVSAPAQDPEFAALDLMLANAPTTTFAEQTPSHLVSSPSHSPAKSASLFPASRMLPAPVVLFMGFLPDWRLTDEEALPAIELNIQGY